jgi:Cysteine-rich secretory protein family
VRTLLRIAIFLILIPQTVCLAQQGASRAEQTLFEYTNHERTARGLPALRWDDSLARAARQHAERMARENTLSHQLPGEPDLGARLTQAAVRYNKCAENIAEGPNTLDIHDGWMNSPPHRASLLDQNLDAVGIGVAERRGVLFAVQDFSHTIANISLAEQEKRVGQALKSRGLKLLVNADDARKACSGKDYMHETHQAMSTVEYTTADLAQLPPILEAKLKNGRFEYAAVGACTSVADTAPGLYHLAVLLFDSTP